jgi:NAD(P)-dependent dehydrogenase (short-subunit alcohol dehydrogenase family)
MELDLADDAAVQLAPARMAELLGSPDILVNNAAFVGESDLIGWGVKFAEQSVDTWRSAIDVNLTAAFALCQAALPYLAKRSCGSIINISSIYGVLGPDWSLYEGTIMGNPAAYAASKGGLIQLTRWLATTLAPAVRVNSVSPGGIARGQPDEFVKRYEARTPLRRMATEEDFKGIIALLASDASSYITGQDIMLDGGWSAW